MPLIILAEADVQNPMQRVLDPPMTAHPSQVLLRRPGRTTDEVADLEALHTIDHPMADHHHNRREPLPETRVPDPLRLGDHTTSAGLPATAANFFRLPFGEVHTGLALIQRLVERPLDVLVEMRLVLLGGQ